MARPGGPARRQRQSRPDAPGSEGSEPAGERPRSCSSGPSLMDGGRPSSGPAAGFGRAPWSASRTVMSWWSGRQRGRGPGRWLFPRTRPRSWRLPARCRSRRTSPPARPRTSGTRRSTPGRPDQRPRRRPGCTSHPSPGRAAAAGIERASVTLHVGLDTFQPLEGEFIDEHQIHREWYVVPAICPLGDLRGQETRRPDRGGRHDHHPRPGDHRPYGDTEGWTDLYITPPHRYRSVDALITNFHLPRSSLLLLVTAFVQAGMPDATPLEARDTLLATYRAALEAGYRFYSYGDAMLIR